MLCLAALAVCPMAAQNTQVAITGRVVDSRTGLPLAGAHILYQNYETGVKGSTGTGDSGYYSLPSLPPGTYSLRAERKDYQARELQARELFVAATLEINFTLRPLQEVLQPGDYNSALLPDQSAILPVLGPDLEAGRAAPVEATNVQSESRQPSLSYVIDPKEIAQAPLSARNVYSLIVTLPGVAASQDSGRGLQISANGQRASASNYLLDGVQNNDFVNTGAFSATAPEAIQEYRVSTNNYSAEYGQTGGFIANAVTRQGGSAYHATIYGYLDNEALDANTFQNNLSALPRNPFKQIYAGYSASGRIWRDRLFFSSAFERLDSKSLRNPQAAYFIEPAQLQLCTNQPASPMLALYNQFPLQTGLNVYTYNVGGPCRNYSGATLRPPVGLYRNLALNRLDYQSPSGRDHIMARVAISRETQPDFVYSIFQGLTEALTRNTASVAISYIRSLTPSLVNDLRVAWNPGSINATRPHPEIPVLQLLEGITIASCNKNAANLTFGVYPDDVPDYIACQNAEQQFSTPSGSYGIDFSMNGWQSEVTDGLTWTHGRHLITAGGGMLLRRPEYRLSYLDQGLYYFGTFSATGNWLQNFANGVPQYYELPLNRIDALQKQYVPSPPSPLDRYSDNQFFGYIQENFRLRDRLTLNFGVRYESFGSLTDESGPQTYFEPGAGQNIEQRISSGTLQLESRSPYRAAHNNWAGRFGVSYNPWNKTVFRVGYGTFYDRPFDNLFLDGRNGSVIGAAQLGQAFNLSEAPATLFQNGFHNIVAPVNGISTPEEVLLSTPQGYELAGIETQYQYFQTYDNRVAHSYPMELLWTDRNLRTPYVESWFASLQQQLSNSWQLEVNHSGSLGRKLISTDLVNRLCSADCSAVLNRLNTALPDILYRSNSGASDYFALDALLRYRTSHGFFQAAYTYSHSIDNISDPMLSDLFNLADTNPDTIGQPHSFGVFTRQFDSRADRGDSDFDIRHNLVFYSIWESPGLGSGRWLRQITRSWTFSQMAVFRFGLPYTLFAPYVLTPNAPWLVGARMDIGNPVAFHVSQPVAGGVQLVNPSLESIPAPGDIGNLGRNELRGPGFWNVDLSLTRSFPMPLLGEHGRLHLSASAFNALNHSNLGPPDSNGLSMYGANQNQTEFPASLPLFPTPRRVQLQVKLTF
jgi:hypothetical protein